MAEGGQGSYPQVFVVDSQANLFPPSSTKKKTRWMDVSQKLLLLLVGLVVLGLFVEGHFIYQLYRRTEVFSLCQSGPRCQNRSSPRASARQGGAKTGREEAGGDNEIQPHVTQVQQKPFAHLICSNSPVGERNVVQWENKEGDAVTFHMGYNNGSLLVEEPGYYFLYSKVQLNAAEECSLIQHKVMKDTRAYDKSLQLMKSKSFRCRTPKPLKAPGGDDLWDSYLAGIFHLQRGDQIFVTLENIHKLRPGSSENFMGAFMI